MKKLLLLLIIVAACVAAYFAFFGNAKDNATSAPKQKAIVLKTHSDKFNNSVDRVIDNYLDMKNAFVNSDTALAKSMGMAFLNSLDSIPLQELDKDKVAVSATAKQSIDDIKANAGSMIIQPNITEMRRDFSMITEMMYPSFFQSINYEGKKLYLESCPMAFNDNESANWLSADAEIVNPYLGKDHPKYKAAMLNCGEVKDSVFIGNKK